ncbi:hypothetical protein FGO68_gene7638 [Halteria grandinella]|uniref:Methyltransferase-like protein 5 n=1 Tax=Halteria grandinella TaxID=5974 RepID=A0A8J8NJU7_HALGN|nr:hypothetical protein FGO68_gene7638 [Halteria grandinella]
MKKSKKQRGEGETTKKLSTFKLKSFITFLSQVAQFPDPKIDLEQYMTPPDIAANLFSILHQDEDSIENKRIADFCSGTGMYSCASTYFNPLSITGFEIDPEAIEVAQENVLSMEIADRVDFINCDILKIVENNPKLHGLFDTVVMNPPFGTKNNEGIDMKLLSAAITCCKGKVFSLHKESTSAYIQKYVKEQHPGLEAELMHKIEFDLPNTYKFHKKKSATTEVVLVKIDVSKREVRKVTEMLGAQKLE